LQLFCPEMEEQLLHVLQQSESGKISRVAALKVLKMRRSRSALDKLAVAINSMVLKGEVTKIQGHSIQLAQETYPDATKSGLGQGGPHNQDNTQKAPSSDLESKISSLDLSTSESLERIVALETDLDSTMENSSGKSKIKPKLQYSQIAYRAGVLSEGIMAKLLELDGITGVEVTPEIRSLRQQCVRRIQTRLEVADAVVKRIKNLENQNRI